MSLIPSITIGGRTAVLTCHMAALSGRFRQNSAAAIRECVDAGVARLEIDVHSLTGGDYVVSHERRLERETTGAGSIGAATVDDVRAVRFLDDAADGPSLLSDVVAIARGGATELQLDLKDWRPMEHARLQSLLNVVAPIKERVIVTAGEDWNLRLLHDADPTLAIGFDPGRYIGWGQDEPFLPRALGAYGYRDDHPLAIGKTVTAPEYLHARFEAFASQCPAAREMFLDYRLFLQMLDDGFNAAGWLHDHSTDVTVWTVDHGSTPDAAVERMVDAGVDRITTNTPLAWVEVFGGNA